MTDWSLFFSGRPGYRFAQVYEAPADPRTRWVVLRKPHLEGHWKYSAVVRDLVGQRDPVALIPPDPAAGQLQLRVYDRLAPAGQGRCPRAVLESPRHSSGKIVRNFAARSGRDLRRHGAVVLGLSPALSPRGSKAVGDPGRLSRLAADRLALRMNWGKQIDGGERFVDRRVDGPER